MAAVRQAPTHFRDRRDLERESQLEAPALDALLRRHFHSDASVWLRHLRLDATAIALRQGRSDLTQLAEDLGWPDLSRAEGYFSQTFGMSQQAYLDLPGQLCFSVHLPSFFRRPSVLAYLGRDPQSLYERVDGYTFRFAFRSPLGPVTVKAEIGERSVTCHLDGPGSVGSDVTFTAHALLRRYLGWTIDPSPFEEQATSRPLHKRLIADRHGLSIPQTPSLFDGLVWVVAGQQVSLPVAFALRRRLGKACGTPLGDDLWLAPGAEEVAALDHDTLRACSWSERKTEYVQDLARAICDGSLDLTDLQDASAVRIESTLLARRGLGPWSVNYLMMRSFGLSDCVPIGDAALKRNLRRFFELDKAPDVETTWRLMESFAPFRSLATFHFWASDKDSQ